LVQNCFPRCHGIGPDGWQSVYLYSLVTMDITPKQLTNVEHAEGISAPMTPLRTFPPSRRRK
jgi:hypothetical protein